MKKSLLATLTARRRGKLLLAGLLLAALLISLCGCGGGDSKEKTEVSTLRFADATSIDALTELDGKTVAITGYMATLSPLSGDYMYLMNLPYQSCPFCVPHTTQLANTMAVYAKEGKSFEYTDQAIRVTGTLEIGTYTDDYGYEYTYRVTDASYEIVDLGEVSSEYALWQSIASDGIVADINSMFDYLCFITQWPDYQVNYTDDNGNAVSYFLYPGDAENYLADDSAYGYASYAADGYFEGLTKRVNAISSTELTELTDIISDAQLLEQDARAALAGGSYTYSESEDKYTLNDSEELVARFNEIYARFSQWLSKWEL